MGIRLEINDKEFLNRLRTASSKGIRLAGALLHRFCQRALNVPNTGQVVSVKDVRKQAKEQLKDAKKGLIKVRGWNKTKKEDFEAWYWYEKDIVDSYKRSLTVYPYPSKPGEPPRKRTGFGQQNVFVRHLDEGVPRSQVGVGANAMYMFWLEMGTKRVARRPWLVSTLLTNKDEIAQLAAIGGKDEIK